MRAESLDGDENQAGEEHVERKPVEAEEDGQGVGVIRGRNQLADDGGR